MTLNVVLASVEPELADAWQRFCGDLERVSVHRDPADRIIIATALESGAAFVAPDGHFSQYPGVRIVW